MTLSTLTPFLYHLSDVLLLPDATLNLAFHLFLPWMVGCAVLICLGVELHYRELRRTAWTEPTYATIGKPIVSAPIWEQVQPDWRAV